MADWVVTLLVLLGVAAGLLFAAIYAFQTAQIELVYKGEDFQEEKKQEDALLVDESGESRRVDWETVFKGIAKINKDIDDGAKAFLNRQYLYIVLFGLGFGLLLFLLLGIIHSWTSGIFTTIAFIIGAITSMFSGYIGMKIATFSNARTAVKALDGYGPAFVTAFKAGCVMGFALTCLALLNLFILIHLFGLQWKDAESNPKSARFMYEAIAGYGLGGSYVALFGRVGGGIYTKAADVGADLVGKVEENLDEDDPRNPAVIADNVGDNVGDIAGMGADLFGSFAESACAALVISAQSPSLYSDHLAMMFPLVLAAAGVLACILTSFVATHLLVVSNEKEIEPSLKRQILVSTILLTPIAFIISYYFLPDKFEVADVKDVRNYHIFFCVVAGLWSGMIIGYITEYYTSHAYGPTRELSQSCEQGAAPNIIFGLALGYKSAIVPVFAMAVTIYLSYSLAGMYGIACAALGILSPLSIDLTIDAYGPICDNAGGIAEMAHMPKYIREKTDALDGAGNTTAAIGKGFAIGSAAFVSLALFGAFVTTVGLTEVNILRPFQFAGLLVGAMLPYWFSAMTMKSVGVAAQGMVKEVRRQFDTIEGLREGRPGVEPDYANCVAISTDAALKEMVPPGLLVMLTPIVVGFFFGVEALAGVLAGTLVSGVQVAISASNTGGAWDNAKKFIGAGGLGEGKGKGSAEYHAAVIGDTVGDPLKDTSGPSLNILIKLTAIISLVFGPAFPSVEKGGLIVQLFR